MKRINLIVFFTFCAFLLVNSQVVSEFRNLGRTGVYNETGLLKQWPAEGPKLLWYNDSLPAGHSSVSIVNNTIYLTGKTDSMDVLIALDMNGKIIWQVPYGRAWDQSFPESRCTPTIEGNHIYVSSGLGDLAKIDAPSGKIIWTVKAGEKFKAHFNAWGVAESIIIKGDMLFFSPIGKETTTVALNKNTGETIWQSESIGDSLAYVSPILVNYNNIDMIVNVGASYIFAVNAENGKILWKFKYIELDPPKEDWAPSINCTTPLYSDGHIYVNSGYDHVGAMLKMNEDATAVELVYSDSLIDTHHGGVVKVGDYIYGSNWINNGNGNWCCIEWKTGKAKYETKWENKGSIIANDGMLYCYEEKRGNIALVKADPEKFEPISTFKVPYGKGPYWAHPVIKDGVLYVRHGGALMAYDIKNK